MKFFALLCGKIISVVGKLMGRGTDLPGRIVYKLDNNIFSKLVYPDIRIIVTGSSGKGSTSKIIAKSLINNGYKLVYNESGANMWGGVLTSILNCTSLSGKVDADAMVLEMDERSTKYVYQGINPTHLLVTNLTKDQPPRQHDIDFILSEITKNLPDSTMIITNGDDPFMRNLEINLPNKVEYYGITKNKHSYDTQLFENLNVYHCPKCGALLSYDYYNFETLGKYTCPECDFSYTTPKYNATDLDLDSQTFIIDNKTINTGGEILYNAYNTVAAYAMLSSLGFKIDIDKSINNINDKSYCSYKAGGKTFYNMSCKAENASTYNQIIFKAASIPGLKDYIIGWKEISRRYVHYDLSWLYDVEFELLNDKNLNNIYCLGIDADNIKQRLLIAGIDEKRIITGENFTSIKDNVIDSEASSICGILNFDYCKPFDVAFKEA